jgi:tetratricopeptide (TPR) repeat protein
MLSIPFARLHALAIVLPLTLAAVAAEEPQAKKSDGPAGGGREAAEAPHGYFQRAWHYETAEGKVEEALAMYRGLAAQADAPGSLRAKALYRAAICLRKLQRPEEARDVLQRIGKEFPDVVEVAQAAQRELAEESSGDAIVRRKAEELLVELWTANRNGPGPVTPFAKATSDLEAIGPRAAPYVIDALAAVQPHPAADYLAAMLMRFVGTDASVAAAVRRLLREGPTETRLALLGALRWEKGGAEWRELIVELATDRDAKIRAAVARALRDDTDRTAHDTAVALAGDPVPAVRMAALWVLGQMLAGPGDLAVLRAAYADPDAGVRAAAVAAVKDTLGRAERGGEVDLSREVTLLADPSREVLAALVELFGAAPGGLPAGAIEPLARRIDELREFRGSPGPPGSGVGVPMPGKTPFDNAARLLIAKRAARALPVYIAVLAENREPLVADALEAVAAVGDAAAVPALLGLLTRKPEPRPAPVAGAPIRRAGGRSHTQTRAFEILTQELGSHATLEALAERLTDLQDFQNEALDKLLGSGSEDLAATVFVRFTRLGPQERRRIVSHPALARASRERAREVLDQALTDGEEEVRVEALKTIRSRFWSPEWVPALLAAYADSRRRSQENTAVAILHCVTLHASGNAESSRSANRESVSTACAAH